MKFLVLAYGDAKDWEVLSEREQNELLAADVLLRERGDIVAAVEPKSTVVRAWDGTPVTSNGPFATGDRPLAGFGIIEANSVDEVVKLVAKTPCARAKGAVEIRAIAAINP